MTEQKLTGIVGEIVSHLRRADGEKAKRLVTRVNEQFPGFTGRILAAVPARQQVRLGLFIEEASGRLALAPSLPGTEALAPARPDYTDSVVAAVALERARSQSPLAVDRTVDVFFPQSEAWTAIRPDNAERIWDLTPSPTGRVAVMRAAACIVSGEVSRLAHKGEYGTQNSGYGSVAGHAARLMRDFDQPPAPVAEPPQHMVGLQSIDHGTRIPFLRVSTLHSSVTTTDGLLAKIGDYNGDWFPAPSRVFSLTTTTTFALGAEARSFVPVGPSGSQVELDAESAALLMDCVEGADTEMLAPAATSFVLSCAMDVQTGPGSL